MNYPYQKFLMERLENMDYVSLIEKIRDRDVFVWGGDPKGLMMADILMKHGIKIAGVMDSNLYDRKTKFGTIQRPNKVISQGNRKRAFIFVTLMLKNIKILNELKDSGFDEDDFFYPGQIWSFIPEDTGMVDEYYMEYLLARGSELAKQLDTNRVYILLWRYHIGDTVFALARMDEFKRAKLLSSITVIVEKKYENLARMFLTKEDEILALYADELECLYEYSRYKGRSAFHIIGIDWKGMPCEISRLLAPDMFASVWLTSNMMRNLGLPYRDRYECKYIPGFGMDDKRVKHIIDREEIQHGNSVIFIPYAKAANMLPNKFWDILAEKYKKRGYRIYTNVADGEKGVPGTKALSVPLEYIIDVVNYAGHAIGVRCGLMDLLALGQCHCQVINSFEDMIQKMYVRSCGLLVNGKDSILYKNAHYVDLSKLDCEALAEEIIDKDLGLKC